MSLKITVNYNGKHVFSTDDLIKNVELVTKEVKESIDNLTNELKNFDWSKWEKEFDERMAEFDKQFEDLFKKK